MRGVLPLPPVRDVARVRKPRHDAAVRRAGREAADMIEVQVAGHDDVDVFGGQAGFGQRRDRDGSRARARRSRALFASILSPQPASMSSVLSPRTISGRMPSGIRLRSSGGSRFSHSVRGTTPNMAPPSRRMKPSRERQQLEVAQRVPADGLEPRHLRRRLLQLDQHAVRRRRVDERHQRSLGAGARPLVDQPDATRLAGARAPRRCRRRAGPRDAGRGRASRRTSRSASRARWPRAARATTGPSTGNARAPAARRSPR